MDKIMLSIIKTFVNSTRERGINNTLKDIPEFIGYKLKSFRYLRYYHKKLSSEGFDKAYGTDTAKIIEGYDMGVFGTNGENIYRYETSLTVNINMALNK
jgi:hypothetical protein